jgi:hypothetical protein
MRGRAEAAHFTNTQRAHDGAAIGRAATDNLDIGSAPAEGFEFASKGKNRFEIGRENIRCTLGIVLPGTVEHRRRNDDGSSR